MADKSGNFYGVILAGGTGTRFWPLSRELNPKQTLKLFGAESLIEQCIKRLLPIASEEKIVIVTGAKLRDEIRNHLVSAKPPLKGVKYLVEPLARNTAAAIGLAATYLFKLDPSAILGVFPSDHTIKDKTNFLKAIETSIELANKGFLVTFGIPPERPETGYGYIEQGNPLPANSSVFHVDRFAEKPSRDKAEEFLKNGGYFWNSGIFIFTAQKILEEIEKFMPELYEKLKWFSEKSVADWDTDKAQDIFSPLESISIDYGVLERSKDVLVIPVDLGWSDMGSFLALENLFEKDEQGNVVVGNVVDVDSKDSIIYTDKHLVAALGLKDMIVINTHDAVLICPKNRTQEVRKIVDILKKKKAEEYLTHRTVYRPWGSYTVLEKGPGYKIKLVEVFPKKRLSSQLHHHRSEHWVVLSGTAKITLRAVSQKGEEEYLVHANESTFIPPSTVHRLENPGIIPLKIIEVQNGEYLEEDDIVRFEDDFGRQ